MESEVDLRVRATLKDGLVHVCVYLNREMEDASSPEACGNFTRQGAEQVARLLEGLRHGDAALRVHGLAEQLSGE